MTTVEQRNSSPSPNRGFGSKLSSIGAKITRGFGNSPKDDDVSAYNDLIQQTSRTTERSQSRGRDALQSTGRGGFGNIRAASATRDASAEVVTRGREPIANPTAVYSTGRGGAGNLRSPSREASRGPTKAEKEVIENYVAHQADGPISTGRGGLGNITSRSRSREAAREVSRTRVSTTGRGGAGNVREGDAYEANALDEKERGRPAGAPEGLHSTGRGGFANITEAEEPALERPSFSATENKSTGRGGAGNIIKN